MPTTHYAHSASQFPDPTGTLFRWNNQPFRGDGDDAAVAQNLASILQGTANASAMPCGNSTHQSERPAQNWSGEEVRSDKGARVHSALSEYKCAYKEVQQAAVITRDDYPTTSFGLDVHLIDLYLRYGQE